MMHCKLRRRTLPEHNEVTHDAAAVFTLGCAVALPGGSGGSDSATEAEDGDEEGGEGRERWESKCLTLHVVLVA